MWPVACYHSNLTARETSDWQNAAIVSSLYICYQCQLFRDGNTSHALWQNGKQSYIKRNLYKR